MHSEFKDNAKASGKLALWKIPANKLPKENLEELTRDELIELVANLDDYGEELDIGDNLVVDVGRQTSAMEKAGEWPVDPVTTFCVGTGGYTSTPLCDTPPNPPLGTDTALYAQVDERPIQSITHPNIAANTFVALIGATELNGQSFSEWGLKMASGKLYSRRTTKPYPKESAFAILAKWTIQH